MSEVPTSSNSVEANRQNFNIDWRAEKRVFSEQMAYFCMKAEMADVEFVFNRPDKITVCLFTLVSLLPIPYVWLLQKIPAHTFALGIASEVFQKELTYDYENVTKKRSKVLQVRFVKNFQAAKGVFILSAHFCGMLEVRVTTIFCHRGGVM